MGYASLLFVPLALVITVALADTTESSWASETTSVSGSSGGDTTPSDAGDSRWTFYYIGGAITACGDPHYDYESVVALNAAEYEAEAGPGPHCGKEITLSYGGRTHPATIVDKCPGCPSGGLDLSPSLFSYFADQSLGHVQGTWWYNNNN